MLEVEFTVALWVKDVIAENLIVFDQVNRDTGGSVGALIVIVKTDGALPLWGAAERLRAALSCRSAPAARATYERAVALARAQLGDEAFAAAWAAGEALTLEQAIAEALALS